MTKHEAVEKIQTRIANLQKIIQEDLRVYNQLPDESPAKGTIGRMLRKREVVAQELQWALSIVNEIDQL
ncbi:MAG TPA: hypothetical protein VK463_07605 [Desulfomonilaceae bacterium]|nr:hypothetical protein [Desulfomonilaceae bacterium]